MSILKNLPLPTKTVPIFERGQLTNMLPIEYGSLPDGDDNPLAGIAESMATANSTMATFASDDVSQTTAVIAGSGWLIIWLAVGGLGVVLFFALPLSLALILTGGAGVWAYLREQKRMDAKDPAKLKLEHNLKLAQLRAWERQQQRRDAMRVIEQNNAMYARQAEQQQCDRVRLVTPQHPMIEQQPQPVRRMLPAPAENQPLEIEVTSDEYEFTEYDR